MNTNAKQQNQAYLEMQAIEIFDKSWDELVPHEKDELKFELSQMIIRNY